MKINFIIVGSQKSGTTTLFDILSSHPHLIGSKPKEPDIFLKKNISLGKYFDTKQQESCFFEASTKYTFSTDLSGKAIELMYEHNPSMKFIYIIRNPIDRIASSYKHFYERGYIDYSFNTALNNYLPLIEITKYYSQIKPYVEKFGRDNILILKFEDLINDKENTVKEVSKFLNIDHSKFNKDYINIHSNNSKNKIKFSKKYDLLFQALRTIRKKISPAQYKIILKFGSLFLKPKENKPPAFSISEDQRMQIKSVLEEEIKQIEKLMGEKTTYY
ncbi:MAG: sulfotransferase [Candidatus Thiothrix putei]|uniref:Sulfotransferase n=1 Tax=Candidatus Thiothrix putei TaxID=3080811 RepID=A0AA95HFA7_9GAMM|nr:MAG: sulfotransferase [Candidatus Thiothrix putei]